jgi:hypothetical protein
MTGSNTAYAGGLIIVTEIDYVTLYPSMVKSLTVDLSSLATLTVASPTLPTSTTLFRSGMVASISRSDVTSSLMLTSLAQWSMTTMSAFPSNTAAIEHQLKFDHKAWNDRIASLSLAAIVLIVLLLLSLMVYAIYQRIRGKCHTCQDNERQIEKYKNGELKRVSPDMVKSRGLAQNSCYGTPSDRDAELGDPNESPNPAKVSFWDRVNGAFKSKVQDYDNQILSSASGEEHTIGGRPIYTETNEDFAHRSYLPAAPPPPQARDYDPDSHLNYAYSPPSPSIYSRPGASDVSPPQEQYARGDASHGNMPDDQQLTSYSAYLENVWGQRKDANIAENQTRTQYRSRTYGGLPHPEDFDDVYFRDGL